MSIHEDIDQLLQDGVEIFKKELNTLSEQTDPLTKEETNKLVELVKTLVIIRKDWRLAEKEVIVDVKKMSTDEINAIILHEAEKLKNE